MWMSEVEMKVWIRGIRASRMAPQAASMSALWVRARPHTVGPSTLREIASTASKSPGEGIGKPASITSTPRRASCCAISTFSAVFSEIPGDCSPSRSVVSKMWTRFASDSVLMVLPPSPAFPNDLVSRGCRAAQRYSPRGGRGRRSARLSHRCVIRRWSLAEAAAIAKLDRTTVLALFAMSMSVLVIANDFSAINVALPTMEEDFSTNVNTIQWVINAYALTFGVMIVTGGRLADMFGRRRAFFAGTAIFASMSLLGGLAQTEAWLIASRVAMGIGGALMWPAILGMTFALLPAEKAGLAGGIVLGAAGFGNAVGPLIGGVLTDALSWRWIFFLNVPISAFAVLVTYYLVRVKEPEAEEQRIDYPGIAALSEGLVSLLIALDRVDEWGWADPRIVGLLALSALLVAAFVPIERRAGLSALVPRAVMRNESFRASCVALIFMSATFFSALLYLPQFMQKHLGYSPLEAGVGMLPFLGTFAVVSFIAGPLYNRVGAKPLAAVGAACIPIAPRTFSPTATTAGVTSVDESQSSLAGGILYMCQIAGGSIGLGLTTTVFSAQDSFVDGIDAAFRLDAALSLVGFLIALFFVGGRLFRVADEESAT